MRHTKRYRLGAVAHLQSGLGTARRLRALQAIGWTVNDLAGRLGVHESRIRQLANEYRGGTVTERVARQVAQLYRELENMPGPSESVRRRCERRGWAPPIAWDYDTIDDPCATPYGGQEVDVDPVVVERILAGDWRLKAARAERLQVIAAWRAAGGSLNELERHTGWNCRRDLQHEQEAGRDVSAA